MSLVTILFFPAVVISTFLLWEAAAWFSHNFKMPPVPWTWHRPYHTKHGNALERDDLYALVFSISSITLFCYATVIKYNLYLISLIIGITYYGIFYLLFHDILIHHQRIKLTLKLKSRFLLKMINALYVYHSRHSRRGCEAFESPFVPKKYELNSLIKKFLH